MIQKITELYHRFEPQIEQFKFDVTIGLGGYLLAIQVNWIEQAEHILTGLVTALVCCAGVHYLKKLLSFIDNSVKKLWKKTFK
jgi:hypothetical protein